MKKLLCIAFFSIAIMANAADKKEIVTDNSKEVKIEKATTEKTGDNTLRTNMFFGCASQGNEHYAIWRDQGYTHRQARAMRRAWVRDCRGGGWL